VRVGENGGESVFVLVDWLVDFWRVWETGTKRAPRSLDAATARVCSITCDWLPVDVPYPILFL